MILTGFKVQAQEIDPAFVSLCKNYTKISEIASTTLPTLFPATSPIPPFTGVVVGMVQRTSVMVDLCEFVNSFSEWNDSQRIWGSKRFINDLTGRKFQDDFDMVDKTWNMANSVYDFENGEKRKGGMESASTQREMNQYMKDLNEYSSKKQMSEAQRKRSEAGYVSEVKRFSDLVAKNANLNEAMNCPDTKNSPNYQELYKQNKIDEEEAIRRDAQRDMDFFKDRLYQMGRFMAKGTFSKLNQFIADTDRLEIMGTTMTLEDSSYKEETYKPGTRKDKNGHAIPEKVVLTKKFQIFTAKNSPTVFTNYRGKYSDEWQTAVRYEYLQKSTEFGVFAGAGERVERTFRDLNYECTEKKLMGSYSTEKSDYDVEYERRRQKCRAGVEIDQKKAENLFQYYAVQYSNALYREKKAVATIWTFESRYLGKNRMVTNGDPSTGFKTENVKCSEHLQPADMQRLAIKQEQIGTEIQEIIAKNKMQGNARKTIKNEERIKYNKNQARQIKAMEQNAKMRKENDRANMGIAPTRMGIGTNPNSK